MPKYHGKIGFVKTVDAGDGVWKPEETIREYYGDILRTSRQWQNGERLNNNIVFSNNFSIVGDDYIRSNLGYMRWILYNGIKWEITSVEVQRPRLVLTVGGIYNG